MSKRKIPHWFWVPPLIILAAVAVPLWWLYSEDHFARQVATIALPSGGIILILIWSLCVLSWLPRLKIILGVLGLSLLSVGFFFGLLRRENSASGSSMPNFVWRWTPEKDEGLVDLASMHGDKARMPSRETIEGLTDVLQYLGPKRDGSFEGVTLDPDWNSNPPKELWRHRIGLGWGSFAVAGGRAVTQEQRGEKEYTICYDLLTGKPLWAHANVARFEEEMGGDGPRATPAIADGRVFAQGATGILDCLDLKTGTLIWSKNVLTENKANNLRWGKSASPLLLDDMIVVSLGRGGPTLAAYARADGQLRWTGGEGEAAYASPVLGTLAGVRQIISTNAKSITGHDAKDGKVLWSAKWFKNMPKVAMPMPLPEDHVLAPVGYSERGKLLKISAAADGTMSAREVWASIKMKVKFSNVCVKGDYAYGLDETTLACINWKTGKRVWKDGKYGYGQNILAGDYLIIQAEDGFVALVDASPDGYKERSRLEALSSMTWNTPTLAGKFLLVRNDIEAVCYELPVK